MKSVFIVEGMHCKMCAARVEKAALKAGAISASVELETRRVTVEHECGAETIIKAISDAGYPASIAD